MGALHFAANVDNIRRDEAGRVRFHYTIIDFAARWESGEPRAGSDVSEAVWARLDQLDSFALWSEAIRVIGDRAEAARLMKASKRAVNSGADAGCQLRGGKRA